MGVQLCEGVINQTFDDLCRILRRIAARKNTPIENLLDIGCWDGDKTMGYAEALGLPANGIYGVDYFDEPLKEAQSKFKACKVDLEQDALPFDSNFFDIVICNQVFEHLKQVYRPMSEIHRILRPGGVLLFSVPNLASLHNRLLMLFGAQPTSIRIIGPHVRGFTHSSLRKFIELNGMFHIVDETGVGFHPFPAKYAKLLARTFPSLSHTVIFAAEKREASNMPNWIDIVSGNGFQTTY